MNVKTIAGRLLMLALLLPLAAVRAQAQTQTHAPAHPPNDPAGTHHAGVMTRGAEVMGFDQTKTTHHFLLRPDGGNVEVTANDAADQTSITQIRAHLQHITTLFAQGNFSAPMLIHAQEPPGVPTMQRAKEAIRYRYEPMERGARLRLVASDPAHIEAVHAFLRFQISDHRTGDPLTVGKPDADR